jgi:hypothetical protein
MVPAEGIGPSVLIENTQLIEKEGITKRLPVRNWGQLERIWNTAKL